MQIRYFLVIAVGSIALLYLLSRRRRELPSWLIIVPGLIVIGAMAAVVATQWDDAYITYRYADNLAKGHGPVYNPGERVEGYTNPLWMLLLAGGIAVGVPPTILALLVAALLLVALFLLLDRILVQEGLRGAWLRGTLPVALGLSPAFVLWWFSGMEVPAYALLILAIPWCLSGLGLTNSKSARRAGLLLAVMVLIRPDAILMAMVGVVYLLSKVGKSHWRHWAKSAAWLLGPLAVVLVALTAFRLAYYGEWLPNTFYCKLGGDSLSRIKPGIGYLLEQLSSFGGTGLIVLAAVGLMWGRGRTKGFSAIGFLTFVFYCVFFIVTGGDALGHRFFVHIIPLLYILVWLGAIALVKRLNSQGEFPKRHRQVLGIALLAIFSLSLAEVPQMKKRGAFSRHLHSVAAQMKKTVPSGFQLAVSAAGIIPYESGMPTIDMLGLCDHHIARTPIKSLQPGHQKWDGRYVVSREPDVIISEGFYDAYDGLGNLPNPDLFNCPVVLNEIRSDPRFQRNYSRVSIPLSDGGWFVFWGHNRRDWKSLIPDAVVVSVASDYPQEGRAPQ